MSVHQTLIEFVRSMPKQNRHFVVAFSGGVDSHALLHALVRIRQTVAFEVQACHIQHNIHQDANQWTEHCRGVCKVLEVPFTAFSIDIPKNTSDSLEALARQSRYEALKQQLAANEVLLTAHHADDQAETLMLQLLRGTGGLGMTGIATWNKLGEGYLARPFLKLSRTDIEAYASLNKLHWLDDPSNVETKFDRNYLRHEIMPKLKARWPALSKTFVRFSDNQSDEQAYIEHQLQPKLERLLIDRHVLDCNQLLVWDPITQRLLIRYWFNVLGLYPPSRNKLCVIQNELIESRWDAQPQLKVSDQLALRRFRHEIHLTPLTPPPETQPIHWSMAHPIELTMGQLKAERRVQGHLRPPGEARVMIKFRQGGEECKLPHDNLTRPLKKLMQQWGIPPWQRGHVPLIYYDDQLAAVAGYCVCQPFYVKKNGCELLFKKHNLLALK